MSTPQKYFPTVPLILVAAGTDEIVSWVNKTGSTLRLLSATFLPWTARTAHDTNYTDISVELAGTEVCSEQTTTGDTGNLVAHTAEVLALTATGKDLELADDGIVEFLKTDAGSGLALDGLFVLEFEAIRA